MSYIAPLALGGVVPAVSCVAPVFGGVGPGVSYVAPALVDGFSGPVTFSAPFENVAPASAVALTLVLSGAPCHDDLRGATEVPTVRFRLQDEWLHAERVLRPRAARRGYFFRQLKKRDAQLAAQLLSHG